MSEEPVGAVEGAAPVEAVDLMPVVVELRELWQTTLEREGNLASAVADVIWKATPYGTTEDDDTFAYIVPKGCMHRLVGVVQQNGAHVPVAFRAAADADQSLPLAPRDGLAGSDEAVEAAAKAGYEHCRDVEETEWERGRWERLEPAHRERYLRAAHRAVTAAEPFIAAHVRAEAVAGERQAAYERLLDAAQGAMNGERRLQLVQFVVNNCAVIAAAGSVPVATLEPTEAERWDAFHQGGADWRHDLELGCSPTCPCSNPRPGPVATPPESTVEIGDVQFFESAEAVSGGSGHAERQEMVIQAALDGISWELIGEPSSRTMASPREAAKIVGRLVWESRDAEVARYRAAIENADQQLDAGVAYVRRDFDKPTQELAERIIDPVRAILAAALGDGE